MLCWLDIESTGLDPKNNKILEIGFIITHDDLTEKARWAWVLPFNAPVDEFIQKMHTASGLLEECKKAQDLLTTFNEMKAWLSEQLGDEKPPLCGSSVGFDKSFLKESQFSSLLDRFHYRIIDVSSLKEMVRRFWPSVLEMRPKDRNIHRALPDLEDSIAEFRHYTKALAAV